MNWPRTNSGLGLMVVEGPNSADGVVGPNPADAVDVVGLAPTRETPMDLIQTMVDD